MLHYQLGHKSGARKGLDRLPLARIGAWVSTFCLLAALGATTAPGQSLSEDAELRNYAVHINRTPPQTWPGYGIYLGNGLVLTAFHVTGNFAVTKPHVLIAGQDLAAALVRQGSLEDVDLTLLSVDPSKLPVRLQMRRLPFCKRDPYPSERVIVAIPEGTARSTVLPPSLAPRDLRGRFDTLIGDVATTGNSGSGVFDAWQKCLLGVVSRKLTVRVREDRIGDSIRSRDIAKYFVPIRDIRAFIPANISF